MSPKVLNTIVILMLAALSLAMLANSMTKSLGRDEQMYCTAGALLAQGKTIYKDFSCAAQMPYHPLLYAAFFKILNTTRFLLVGRILSALCDILVAGCIVGIYRRVFGAFRTCGMLLGLAAAILYVFNPLVDYANGFAWNHDLVILLVCASFWLFISTDFEQKSRYRRVAIIGALLTLATFMRITTGLVQLLFFAVLLTQPAASTRQRCKTILPFLIAGVIVSVWPISVIVQAPRAFFLNLFRIPMLYGEWLHEIGMVHNKLNLTLNSLTKPGYLALILIAIYLYVTLWWKRDRLTITDKKQLLLSALLPLTFFAIALIPPTMWRQYLAMPVPFLVISFAYPLRYLRELAGRNSPSKRFNVAAGLMTVSVLVAVVCHWIVVLRVPKLFNPPTWTPIQLHSISEDIAQRTKDPKIALTLAPLFALEGGCDIYTELSAGSIIYRIADLMSPPDRAVTHTVGPETLAALLEKSPPSAVILGVELEFLEEPLYETVVKAEPEKWEKKIYDNGPIVYFKR